MEHEIIGHTKKAYKVFKNPDKHFWEKVKEILIEVLIIVFAVTFAAFIERAREHSKEKSEAREFVLGLRSDLADEVLLLQGSEKDMDTTRKNYSTIIKLKSLDVDSLNNRRVKSSFSISTFNSRVINGRFEGFKSSGKIQTIENDSLRNDILKFYQQDIPLVDFTEGIFNDNQKRLQDLIIDKADDSGDEAPDLARILTSYKAKLIFQFALGYSHATTEHYKEAIKQAEKIEAEIDKEYK